MTQTSMYIRIYRRVASIPSFSGLAVLPYSEVPRWAYENVNTQAQIITNRKGNVIAPLNPTVFTRFISYQNHWYFEQGIPREIYYEKVKPLEIIQDWWDEENPFISKLSRVYNTQYFKPPYQLLISMICRLYGEENCIHFK
jgi:hypothetical protein